MITTPSAGERMLSVPTRLGALHVRAVGSGIPTVLWPSMFADSHTWDAAVDLITGLSITAPVDWVGNAFGGHVGFKRATRAGVLRSLAVLSLFVASDDRGDWSPEASGAGTLVPLEQPGKTATILTSFWSEL